MSSGSPTHIEPYARIKIPQRIPVPNPIADERSLLSVIARMEAVTAWTITSPPIIAPRNSKQPFTVHPFAETGERTGQHAMIPPPGSCTFDCSVMESKALSKREIETT